MADDKNSTNGTTHELSSINWLSIFPFLNIFRAFRVAIHPGKLLIALAAVLISYMAGRILDGIWGPEVVNDPAVLASPMPADDLLPAELEHYITYGPGDTFDAWRQRQHLANTDAMAAMLVRLELADTLEEGLELAGNPDQAEEAIADAHRDALDDALDALDDCRERAQEADAHKAKELDLDDEQRQQQEATLENHAAMVMYALYAGTSAAEQKYSTTLQEALTNLGRIPPETAGDEDDADKDKQTKKSTSELAREDIQDIRKAITFADACIRAEILEGCGIFETALAYGATVFNGAVRSVLQGQFTINSEFQSFTAAATGQGGDAPGLIRSLVLAGTGIRWLLSYPVFFIIYLIIILVVWGIAGGAICRMAALNVARDERITMREAVSFALQKFSSFVTAPLLPFAFIVPVVLLIGLIGLILGLNSVLSIIAGLLFFVALLGGLVMALLAIGGVGGMALMYPTIASEGSDSFDAISRSFNYLYARPWRTLWYMLVGTVYGTLCFVFVRLLAGLAMLLTHVACGRGFFGAGMNTSSSSTIDYLGRLEAMWSIPSLTGSFFGGFNPALISGAEQLTQALIMFWVFIVVGLVMAFVVSFFLSANTIIYLLLRQVVDATDMSDVYVEEFEEELSPVANGNAAPVGAGTDSGTADTSSGDEQGNQATGDGDSGTPKPDAPS